MNFRNLLFLPLSFSLLLLFIACNGDEDVPEEITAYLDADGDGFGDPNSPEDLTELTSGFVLDDTDCDDSDASINPDADEIPDNDVDENCDGIADQSWYLDADEDGFGNPEEVFLAGEQPTGYVANADDCDDSDENINPDATEIPGNDVDENCDGENGLSWYQDADADGFGNAEEELVAGTQPEGYVANADDCDDTDENINPGADEIPDNDVDEDCDGELASTWYQDLDSDTFGNPDVSQVAVAAPTGYVADNTDCNDMDADINPDATEIKGNDIDEDCDGTAQGAVCGDGTTDIGEECDDGNNTDGDGCSANCTLEETGAAACSDMVDNDGDGLVDCDDPGCHGNSTACTVETNCADGADNDGDGLVDCEDDDCATSSSCVETICNDGLDNDGDGNVDCADIDCGTAFECSVCGNGILQQGEGCDDGNNNDGDGCSAICTVEAGFTCSGSPSNCQVEQSSICGNGIVESPEGCDDGNTNDGDGCSSACTVEVGYTCTGSPSICIPE